LKVSVRWRVQQWGVVPDGAVKERKKRVGQIEGQKGRKRQQGKGEDNSNLTQFLGVRLGELLPLTASQVASVES
jgi:hypothetical protein